MILLIPAIIWTLFLGNILGDAYGWFRGSLGSIVDTIYSVVKPAVDEIWDTINWIYRRIDDAFTAILFSIVAVKDWVVHLIWDVQSWVVMLIQSSEIVTRNIINWVADTARALVTDTANFLGFLIRELRDQVLGRIAQVVEYIGLNTLNAFLHTVDYITNTVFRPVIDFISYLFHGLSDTVRQIAEDFDSVKRWVFDEAIDAVRLVRKAWGWLTFLAEHPFDWWLILLHDAASSGSKRVGDVMLHLFKNNARRIEDMIVSWLG